MMIQILHKPFISWVSLPRYFVAVMREIIQNCSFQSLFALLSKLSADFPGHFMFSSHYIICSYSLPAMVLIHTITSLRDDPLKEWVLHSCHVWESLKAQHLLCRPMTSITCQGVHILRNSAFDQAECWEAVPCTSWSFNSGLVTHDPCYADTGADWFSVLTLQSPWLLSDTCSWPKDEDSSLSNISRCLDGGVKKHCCLGMTHLSIDSN